MDYLGAALLAGTLTSIVLFTSLGGTTWAWGSPQIIGLILLSIVLLPAFVYVESRAEEPILPLSLFRNRTFATTSAVGFIVGFALFGAVTFLPLYLQVTKGSSPTRSGLELTPLMGGLLITSIVSGNLITRWGKYRPFPIVGTAVMAIGLYLLSRLESGTPTWHALIAGVVLGLGLGGVMQVLVLAVQNAVDPRQMGVATSGSTLFRQIGGSIGVSIFGAIFANRLHVEVASRFPPGAHAPQAGNPASDPRAAARGALDLRGGVRGGAASRVPDGRGRLGDRVRARVADPGSPAPRLGRAGARGSAGRSARFFAQLDRFDSEHVFV